MSRNTDTSPVSPDMFTEGRISPNPIQLLASRCFLHTDERQSATRQTATMETTTTTDDLAEQHAEDDVAEWLEGAALIRSELQNDREVLEHIDAEN